MVDEIKLAVGPFYPPADLPVIFADGIANFANSPEMFKFYLFRQDPSMSGVGPTDARPVAQIVMPLSGALTSVAFLNAVIRNLIKTNPQIAKAWEDAEDFQRRSFKQSNP